MVVTQAYPVFGLDTDIRCPAIHWPADQSSYSSITAMNEHHQSYFKDVYFMQ